MTFKKYVLPIILLVTLVAIDQIVKHLAVVYLMPIGSYTVIDGFFSLVYVENTGMAFGLFRGLRWVFVAISIVIFICIGAYYFKMPNTKYHNTVRVFLVILLGGALGNFIDRLFTGYVVDMFAFTFINFPVFNVADIFIVCAAIGLFVVLLFFKEPKIEDNSK